jgi:hypothetical protein
MRNPTIAHPATIANPGPTPRRPLHRPRWLQGKAFGLLNTALVAYRIRVEEAALAERTV